MRLSVRFVLRSMDMRNVSKMNCVVTRGLADGRLWMMYDDNWEAFSERIRNIEVRTIVRFFLAGASKYRVDNKGRIHAIPNSLLQYAGVKHSWELKSMTVEEFKEAFPEQRNKHDGAYRFVDAVLVKWTDIKKREDNRYEKNNLAQQKQKWKS